MTDRADFEVRLTEKVKAPAKKGEKAIEALGDSAEKTARQLTDADKALGRFIDKTGKMREANGRFVKGQGKGGGGLFGGGAWDVFKGNFLTGVFNKMVDITGAVASAASEFVTFGQTSEKAFAQLAHAGDDPAELFEHASALAKRFGLDLFDTHKQYRKLLALQFDPKGIDELIRMGADLRALGTDAEGVQGVITAIGQVRGKGKLQAEEKMQLAERGISGMLIDEEIGKLLGGKSVSDVQKLMQQGKVDAEIGIEAIKNAIKRKLGEDNLGDAGMDFADHTIEGIWGKMKAWAQDTGLKGFAKIAEPVTKVLGDLFDKFRAFVGSEEGADTIQRIADSLGKAAEGAGEFFTKLTVGDIEMLFGKLESAAGTAERIGDAIEFVSTIVGGVASAFDFVGTSIGEFLGSMFADVLVWWDGLKAIFSDPSSSLWNTMVSLGGSLIEGLMAGFEMMAKTLVGPKLWQLGVDIKDTLAEVLGIHSPSRVTMEMGWQLGEGMAIGAERSGGMVESATFDMGEAAIDGAMGPLRADAQAPVAAELGGDSGSTGIERLELHFHIDGRNADDAQELSRELAPRVRLELEALLRTMALEG